MVSSGDDLRARAQRVKDRVILSALIGRSVKLVKRGREHSGLCPFHAERSPSFTVSDDKGFAHCFGCGWHGSAIDFVMAERGLPFADAVQLLEQQEGIDPGSAPAPAAQRQSMRQERESDYIDGRQAAAWVWQAGVPARGERLGEAWLESRGIDPLRNGFLDVARYLPACPVGLWKRWEDPRAARRTAPALIAPILRVSGGRGARELSLSGVHITFLAPDGRGKARFEPWQDRRTGQWRERPARVMWGAAARGGVPIPASLMVDCADDRPAGSMPAVSDWIRTLIDAPGQMVVGEGLESTQSLLARTPAARMAWATLSLGNLEGVAAKDGPQGSLALWKLRGEAELGAPFTLADAGDVTIGVDADMKPLKDRLVQDRPGARPEKRDLSGAERASICAALAAWQWTRAGARSVAVARPPAGKDFNDLDRGKAA